MTLQPPSLKNRKHPSLHHGQAPALGGGERAPIEPYSDQDLVLDEEEQAKVERLMEWFDQNGIEYDKFNPDDIPKLDLGSKAYPNMDVYMHIPGARNTSKWLQAISDIYRKEKSGINRVAAIRSIVSGWEIMETHDFLNWVKFYEAGDHMKYKFAQLWYENDSLGPGYFLQVKKDKVPEEPKVSGKDVDVAKADANADHERRQVIEKQRNKIIGRLDSAEKLLRTQEGHVFSGKEFESLLESIYSLKKKIQMVNKISSSTRLYEDMIVRHANILSREGFFKAANVLYSLAEAAPAAGALPPATPPSDPTGAGAPGVPSGGAATPASPPGNTTMPQSPPAETQPKGISDFLSKMDDGKYAPDDKQVAEDDLEVEDTLEVSDSEDELLVTEAQVPPEEIGDSARPAPLGEAKVAPPKPLAPKPPAPKAPSGKAPPGPSDEPLEVTEDDIKSSPKAPGPSSSEFDSKMQAMLSGITVADVVAKLEDLAKIFKTREVPRQLGIVDMMLDSLGLASYFPSLSEATNKALESNNYISTRVEDILSKLRGAMGTNEVDLKGSNDVEKPEVAGIKGKLQSDDDKEKARKQMRKDQEAAELASPDKETPEVEIDEDLTAPPAPAVPPKAPPAI